jgi:hypothetical protein
MCVCMRMGGTLQDSAEVWPACQLGHPAQPGPSLPCSTFGPCTTPLPASLPAYIVILHDALDFGLPFFDHVLLHPLPASLPACLQTL